VNVIRQFVSAFLALALAGCSTHAAPPGFELPFIIHPAEFFLPAELRGTGAAVDSEVMVAAMIGADGRLTDWLVVGASQPELEPVAIEALKQTGFSPARAAGRPVPAHVAVVFSFAGTTPTMSAQDVENLGVSPRGRRSATPLRVFQLDQLDAPPRLVRDVRPETRGNGTVKLQFFVDQEGRVRLPMVVEADDPDLAKAVLEAVGSWQFNPPMRAGRPVLALVRQKFQFHAP
jgi:TonB family protein